MKPDSNKKILQLLSAEILLQIGFEKSTEHSLHIMTDVFVYYFESLIRKCIPFNGIEPDILLQYLIEDTYMTELYQKKELYSFLDQQISIKAQLKDKFDIECDESLLHSLRILPKGVSLKSAFKNTKTMTVEEKKSMEIYPEIQIDDFMADFIEKSSSQPSRSLPEIFKFSGLKAIEEIKPVEIDDVNLEVNFEIRSLEPRKTIFGVYDEILAEQDFFMEDFQETQRYKILR